MVKKKVGFFGGSFDPVHFGHLNLATEILEAHHLDEVWFCPAWISPHKLDQEPASAEHRLKMLELVIKKAPHFQLIDLEIQRQGPSYTVDTLQALIQKEQGVAFSLIIGEDAVQSFLRWRDPQTIVELVPILVGCRGSSKLDLSQLKEDLSVYQTIKKGVTPTHVMDISSTEVRVRLRKGEYCGHLVPESVLDYIQRHRLYANGYEKM